MRSGRLALGPKTEAFERAVAKYVGTEHAVGVSSGTAALHLIIRALNVGRGDEVITTPFTFVSSTNCILFEHAIPVFVDIDARTLCIDVEQVEAAITPRTRAIIAVDIFGHPADWPSLERIAERYGLALIDDSAEALGSSVAQRRCGSFGCAGVFGFYPNKQITTGEGGMIVTDDHEMACLCRSMSNQGRGEEEGQLCHVRLGYNYRMNELSAALGLMQMSRIDRIILARRRVASLYREAFSDVGDVICPVPVGDVKVSWFAFVIRLSEVFSQADRDAVLRGLSLRGIDARNYFVPVHLQPYCREALGTQEGDLPVAEAAGSRTIALPFSNQLREDEISRVASAVREELECVC